MSSTEFEITAEKFDRIVSSYNSIGINITKENVEQIYVEFRKLATTIKGQYLAHITRVMENYFREIYKNPLFFIKYTAYLDAKQDTPCSSAFYPGRRFVIFYSPMLSEKDLRVRLAHELGHLFLIALNEHHKADKRLPVYEGTTEPLSSVFGIFTISDKNHFYANALESDRNHKNWDTILKDFLELSK